MVGVFVFVSLLSRFDGSSDLRSDFVLVIVDDDVIDIVSFSGVDVDVDRVVDDMLSIVNSVFRYLEIVDVIVECVSFELTMK